MSPLHGLLDAAQGGGDPNSVSPGLVGFLATFALVIAAIFLFRSMAGRLRRLDHREGNPDAGRGDAVHEAAVAASGPGDHPVDERASTSSLEDPGLVTDDDGGPAGR